MLSGNFCGSESRHCIFGGLNFGPGIFGGFVWSPKDFFRFWFLPPFDNPCHLKSPSPQGDRMSERMFQAILQSLVSASFDCYNRFHNSPRSIYQNSNMTSRLSGHFSTFGFVFFVRKSLLGISRQWSCKKFAILTLKPRSHEPRPQGFFQWFSSQGKAPWGRGCGVMLAF